MHSIVIKNRAKWVLKIKMTCMKDGSEALASVEITFVFLRTKTVTEIRSKSGKSGQSGCFIFTVIAGILTPFAFSSVMLDSSYLSVIAF